MNSRSEVFLSENTDSNGLNEALRDVNDHPGPLTNTLNTGNKSRDPFKLMDGYFSAVSATEISELLKVNSIETDVLCGFWNEGEPAHGFWIAGSDSDSDDSDYDNTHRGERGFFIRVVNPDGYFSDSPDGYDLDDCESDSPDGGAVTIYPGPDHQHSTCRHAHLRDFSRTAIKIYNQDTEQGNRFEFVELVEASVRTMVEYAHIVVIFKACQSEDTMVTTSFRAETRSASESFSDSYDIETVVPLHSDSIISPASESKVI